MRIARTTTVYRTHAVVSVGLLSPNKRALQGGDLRRGVRSPRSEQLADIALDGRRVLALGTEGL